MDKDEYLAEIKEIRDDMLRDCDRGVVRRCPICGGTTSTHYEQPPECDCDPEEAR